jgi:hypothetical protein
MPASLAKPWEAMTMFLSPRHDILRIVLVGIATYAGMIVLLRTSGKRTLA